MIRLQGGRRRFFVLAFAATASLDSTPVQATPFGYVVNHGDGNVSVLDTASSQIVATIAVGSEPLGAAVNSAGTRVYVTNQVAPVGTVSVIDTTINGVVGTITVGGRPSGVAVKMPGDRVYVTNRDDKNVSVIDATTNAVIATIPVGNNPLGIAVNPAGSPAYVVNKGSNTVSVIDTTSNEVVATIAVGNDPSHVVVSPNGHRVYVSNTSNASVSVIDTALNSVIATIPVGNIPEGVAVDPSGARLYVANSGPNTVSVVEIATHDVLAMISVGQTPFELAFRPDGAQLFVANRQGGDVSVIDAASNAVVATVEAGFSPTGFGQFIVPALRTPRFGSSAGKCQIVVARQAAKLATLHHGLESACRIGILKAEAAGKGTARAEAACRRTLDIVNPTSKLARAHGRMRAAIARGCSKTLPIQIHAPCERGARDFGATADCLLTQHSAVVTAMVNAAFSPSRPVPLIGWAQGCQTAIAKEGRRFADRLLRDLGKCTEKLVIAAGAGKADDDAVAKCLTTLDRANPISKVSVAREAGLEKIAQKCGDVAALELGSPCDPAASTVAATASCVLDQQAAGVAKLLAAEFNDACVILTRIGVASAYPAVCSGAQ